MRVTRTYLELTDPRALRGSADTGGAARVERLAECPPSFYRWLYATVGTPYRWMDRLGWRDDDVRAHLANPAVSVWLLSGGGAPAGWCELVRHADGSVEIAYFGLVPEFVGRGLGRRLLTEAAERAWALGASRVWLHTCTLDHPAALPNYLARGFRPYRTEEYEVAG